MGLLNSLGTFSARNRRALGLSLALCAALTSTGPVWAVGAEHSAARIWNERLLNAIRKDLARPTVHARNLWHTSVAMWDAWAAYDTTAKTFFHHERATATDIQAARAEAISYASYRLIKHRFATSPGAAVTLAAIDQQMADLGYDINFTSTDGTSPAALGNRIAAHLIAFGLEDGSNEQNGYKNRHYSPVNPPLIPTLPGNPTLADPNRWQPLALKFFVDQNGNVIPGGFPEFLSPEWGQVRAFSLTPDVRTVNTRGDFDYWVFHDPGAPPQFGASQAEEDEYKWNFELVSAWSSHLDPSDGVMWDISPGARGNAQLPDPHNIQPFYNLEEGGDNGTGYPVNPFTGQPYAPQIVPRGDYVRALAEFWADGPNSETPPGHWFTIANYVSDHPLVTKRLGGSGPVLDPLEWDVKVYFALGGALHDVAVTAWGIKGWYDSIRPVSAIRFLGGLGQATDPGAASFNPHGITLRPGLIELITTETTQPGARHAHLAGKEGKIAIKAWRGPNFITDPAVDEAGVGWILAEEWWPYQRPTFVTPPFAGFISGHSTYSRAGATIMTLLTGSPYFPGGLGEFHCKKNEYLVFEEGPSVDITFQWATYTDASDNSSLSRIWGGIHPPCDDIPGRYIGQKIGADSYNLALKYFDGSHQVSFHRGDVEDSGEINISDAITIIGYLFQGEAAPTCLEAADVNNDGDVDLSDPIALLGFMFLGEAPPASPGPPDEACGIDPDLPGSAANLGCDHYASCGF